MPNMKYVLRYGLTLLFLAHSLFAQTYQKVDDWDENATMPQKNSSQYLSKRNGNVVSMAMPVAAPMPMKKIGLAVGGAKDSDNFIGNIEHGYLPKYDAITYEGVFYQHYFDTAMHGVCHDLFCPSYAQALTQDQLTGEKRYYLSVGLNSGLSAADFKRPKLNLVVVMDISGSMAQSFDRYYYDGASAKREHKVKSKMEIANASVAAMMDHLAEYDRLGVVLFDNQAYKVKPLREVAKTDMKAIKRHILALKPKGGTNWSAGYQAALDYFKRVKKEGYENRIVFITDAMPNLGELRKEGLFGLAKKAARSQIHTTFIGVGVDFNPELVEYVSKTRGANYYSVHSSQDFRQRLDKEFDYMVTPLVYDLVLNVASKGFTIDAVYGAPKADLTTGDILEVDTLFPSASEEDRVKGGVILLRLKRIGHADKINLSVRYRDGSGKEHRHVATVDFRQKVGYETAGIRKAILLSQYVTLMKNWIIDMRATCDDHISIPYEREVVTMDDVLIYPPKHPYFPHLSQWERRSCPLRVSKAYQKIFNRFGTLFSKEMKILKDPSLDQERKVLKILTSQEAADREKVDDWHRLPRHR